MASPEVDEVKARVNIVDLIGRYITLKPAGQRFKGRCPFHPDDTPSLMVSPDKGLWHCFGCNVGGDAIGFLMRIERLSFPEALARLAQEAGVEVRGGEGKAKLYRASEEVAGYFARELLGPGGAKARDYLIGRGIGKELWQKYRLGYAPDGWDNLIRALGRMGLDVLRDLGLVVAGERGYYDRFRDRVMFTIHDDQGRPVAFAGRSFSGEPKYLNVPNTPLFTKGTLLYGLDSAKDAIRRRARVVLVEGYTDVISFQTAGIEETVGSMGTALTEAQARLMARYTDRVVIAYDRDAAGESSTLRGLAILRGAGLRVEVATLPPGEDPDTLVRRHGVDAAHAVMAEARPFHRFFLESLAERHDLATIEGKEAALAEAKGFWSEVKKSLPLEHELVHGLADLLSLPEEEVRAFLRGRGRSIPRTTEDGARLGPEELVLHFLIAGKLPDKAIADLEIQDFRPEYRPIVEKWWELRRVGGTPTAAGLAGELDPEHVGHLTQLALLELSFSDEDRAMEDALVRFVYLPRLSRRMDEVRARLKAAEAAGEGEEVRRLNMQFQALCQERLRLLRRR